MAAMLLCGNACSINCSNRMRKKTVDYDVDGSGGAGSGSTDNNKTADSGSLQGKYGIPEECDVEIATGDTGIEKISIDDDEITVPETGDMAIAHYKKKTAGAEEKKKIVEAVFDKDQGIYAYDYEKSGQKKTSKETLTHTNE